jgi:hypothetical protein
MLVYLSRQKETRAPVGLFVVLGFFLKAGRESKTILIIACCVVVLLCGRPKSTLGSSFTYGQVADICFHGAVNGKNSTQIDLANIVDVDLQYSSIYE